MSPVRSTYNYSLVRRILNVKLGGRLSAITTSGDTGTDTNIERDFINSAVRIAMSDIDFRGNIRETALTPNLMDSQWDYELPNDVKADKILDLRPQVTDSRGIFETYDLVTAEEFDRRKKSEVGIYAISNDDLSRKLRISADVDDETLVISRLESRTDQDTWDGFGNTADSDVKTDADDYVEGNGSIRFADTAVGAGDSIIGIENSGRDAFDISSYLSRGSFFYSVRLDTGDTGIKNFRLRLGSDSNNYYEFNDSTTNDCGSPDANWNLIRLDASSRVTTGTPVDTAITYVALAVDRDSGTHLDTDFAFDNLIAKVGRYYRLSYYSRFVWQDTAFALSENSSNDSHALLVQNDELEVIMAKAAELGSEYLRDPESRNYYRDEYTRLKDAYMVSHPSEAGIKTYSYYDFPSLTETRTRRDIDIDS